MAAVKTGVTDNYVAVAAESTYGTAATAFTRVVPARDDSWTPEIQEIDTDAFRPSRQTAVADQTTQVPAGGSGTVEMLIPNSGNFLLLRDLLDSWTDPASVSNASSLKNMVLKSDGSGPDPSAARSLTYQVGRVDAGQARRPIIYSGCVLTDWELSCAVGEPATLTANYDFASRAFGKDSSDASYTAPGLTAKVAGPFYTWRDMTVTIGGAKLNVVTSLSITGDRGLNTELFQLGGSSVKTQPTRSEVPSYGITLECRYDSATDGLLKKWGDDGLTGKVVATLTGREDKKSSGATPIYTSVTATFANAKVMGSEPVMSLNDMTTISLELKPVDPYDGSTVAAQIDVVGAQTAIN